MAGSLGEEKEKDVRDCLFFVSSIRRFPWRLRSWIVCPRGFAKELSVASCLEGTGSLHRCPLLLLELPDLVDAGSWVVRLDVSTGRDRSFPLMEMQLG